MTDRDPLDRLSGLQVPLPLDGARETALSKALLAFDESENSMPATQGPGAVGRLISRGYHLWRNTMKTTAMAGPAFATLMIVPVAGIIAYSILADHPVRPAEQQFAGTGRNEAVPPAKNEARRVAPVPTVESKIDSIINEKANSPLDIASIEGDDAPVGIARMPSREAVQPSMVAPSSAAPVRSMASDHLIPDPYVQSEEAGDRVAQFATNKIKRVADEPVSTFSVDTDTASYAMVRRQLEAGILPDPQTVRVEEMINYFPYGWPAPENADTPFKATVTVMPTPWNAGTKLMHVAIKGYEIANTRKPKANLVFLVDTSGSMEDADKLPLVKSSLRLLLDRLAPDDKVSLVTYAGEAGVALEPTPVADRAKIVQAIERLGAGGSTAGAAGIGEAYRLARSAFVKDGINRVLLATDGDFNVGPSDDDSLKQLIEAERRSGIFLSVLGFGSGNYNDSLMQVLAQNGNGTAAYIDTLAEAEKTLAQEATANLFPIAKDVKIQVEFNPQAVAEYRLVGYESRLLAREDFNNDRIDAGEIGSGHSVTAIYELTPVGSPALSVDALRYGTKDAAAPAMPPEEIAFVKIRFKKPEGGASTLIEQPVSKANAVPDVAAAPQDVRFSVAVAAFGQKLRDADALAGSGYDEILGLAEGARGEDPFGYRAGFLTLVRLAKGLDTDRQ